MPWHLAPQLESNSQDDPLNKEDIKVQLHPGGDVRQYNENHLSPFTIRYVHVFHQSYLLVVFANVCLQGSTDTDEANFIEQD